MKRRRGKPDVEKLAGASSFDADVEYFLRAMTGVVRLAPDPRGHIRAAPPIRTSPPNGAPRPATLPVAPAPRDATGDADAGFVAPGVDRRELRKLRRGDHAPESRLDLHGMTGAEAVERVKRFIDSRRPGERCVCIIHGRGLHSEARIPILKSRVRECLRVHRAVLAFTDAPRADGGAGAVYVLLRKQDRT